jgi:hypothetical protein
MENFYPKTTQNPGGERKNGIFSLSSHTRLDSCDLQKLNLDNGKYHWSSITDCETLGFC